MDKKLFGLDFQTVLQTKNKSFSLEISDVFVHNFIKINERKLLIMRSATQPFGQLSEIVDVL